MLVFETELEKHNLLPRLWVRYVDDVFAITKRENVNDINQILNSRSDSIKFTHKIESNYKLTLLDLELHRVDNKIDNKWQVIRFTQYHTNYAHYYHSVWNITSMNMNIYTK